MGFENLRQIVHRRWYEKAFRVRSDLDASAVAQGIQPPGDLGALGRERVVMGVAV